MIYKLKTNIKNWLKKIVDIKYTNDDANKKNIYKKYIYKIQGGSFR